MGSRIRCFWIEPTESAKIFLRRFVWSGKAKCPGPFGYHDARAFIEERRTVWVMHDGVKFVDSIDHPHADPRWPSACACGYAFAPEDQWQVNQELIYLRLDNGERTTLVEAPVGAMWNAWWMADSRGGQPRGPGTWIGEDGISLVVKTPAGEWNVDAPSKGGCGWSRSGTMPDVTANPSIVMGDNAYHGFLRNGWLEEC